MLDDLRYGWRILLKNPGFAVIAILTMALGIGTNTAVFSLLNAVLLRPLPGIVDPGRLITFYRIQPTGPFDNFAYPDYCDYRDRAQAFSGVAAHTWAPLSFGYQTTERLLGDLVSGNYFEVLGAKPAVGRLLNPSDEAGAADVAVLSYGLWQRRFGGTPNAVGATITLKRIPISRGGCDAGTIPGIYHQRFV